MNKQFLQRLGTYLFIASSTLIDLMLIKFGFEINIYCGLFAIFISIGGIGIYLMTRWPE